MTSLNRVELIGYLGKDPTSLKKSDKGCFARLSIATNQKYKNADGELVQITHWHTVNVSNWLADNALVSLKKGDRVYIVGELQSNTWKDKQDRVHYSSFVQAYICEPLRNKVSDDAPRSCDNQAMPLTNKEK